MPLTPDASLQPHAPTSQSEGSGARVLYLYAQVLRAESTHARQTFQMLALMKEAGLEVELLTLPGGDPWPQGLVRKIYRTATIPFSRSLPLYGSGLRRTWATCVLALAAIRLFVIHRYRAVHCADRSIRIGALIAWLFGARFLFEWRASSGHDLVRWSTRRSRRFLKAVSLVFTDVKLPLSRLRETPLCGRIATLQALPAPCIRRLPPPPVRLGGAAQRFSLAAFSFQPGMDDLAPLLDALPGCARSDTLNLHLYGGTPRTAERVRTRWLERLPRGTTLSVEPLPLSPAAFRQALSPADLVFLPALSSPLLPPIILDIMAAGRAILAVRSPAAETLLSSQNALLARGDRDSISQALWSAIVSPLLCIERAEAAAETIARERDPLAASERLRTCYAFALAPRTRSSRHLHDSRF